MTNSHARRINFSIDLFNDPAGLPNFGKQKGNDRFVLAWLQRAQGEIRIDLARHAVTDHMLCLFTPGIPYSLQLEADSAGAVIAFDRQFLFDPDPGFLLRSLICHCPNDEIAGKMEFIISTLATEYNKSITEASAIIRAWLHLLVLHMINLSSVAVLNGPAVQGPRVLQRFYLLVERNFKTKKLVSEYAEELNVASGHLRNVVKRYSGYTPSYHIQQRIILEAKRLALYSDQSMKEISYELGFAEPAHFSKFFKAICGRKFSEYRYLQGADLLKNVPF